MYTMDFAYDGPIFLVPLSLSYPSSPVHSGERLFQCNECGNLFIDPSHGDKIAQLVRCRTSNQRVAGSIVG